MADIIHAGQQNGFDIGDILAMATRERAQRDALRQREDESWLEQGRALAAQAISATNDPREGVKIMAKWFESSPDRVGRIFGGNGAPNLAVDPSLANSLGDERAKAGLEALQDPTMRGISGGLAATDSKADSDTQRVMSGRVLGGVAGAQEAQDLNTGKQMKGHEQATVAETKRSNVVKEGETHRHNVTGEGFEKQRTDSTITKNNKSNELTDARIVTEQGKNDPHSGYANTQIRVKKEGSKSASQQLVEARRDADLAARIHIADLSALEKATTKGDAKKIGDAQARANQSQKVYNAKRKVIDSLIGGDDHASNVDLSDVDMAYDPNGKRLK